MIYCEICYALYIIDVFIAICTQLNIYAEIISLQFKVRKTITGKTKQPFADCQLGPFIPSNIICL